MLTVIVVLKSHFEAVGESDRPCHSAVFNMKGVLGSSSFSIADGEDSMAVLLRRGARAVFSRVCGRKKQCKKKGTKDVNESSVQIGGYLGRFSTYTRRPPAHI